VEKPKEKTNSRQERLTLITKTILTPVNDIFDLIKKLRQAKTDLDLINSLLTGALSSLDNITSTKLTLLIALLGWEEELPGFGTMPNLSNLVVELSKIALAPASESNEKKDKILKKRDRSDDSNGEAVSLEAASKKAKIELPIKPAEKKKKKKKVESEKAEKKGVKRKAEEPSEVEEAASPRKKVKHESKKEEVMNKMKAMQAKYAPDGGDLVFGSKVVQNFNLFDSSESD